MKPSIVDVPIGIGAVWFYLADIAGQATSLFTLFAAIGGCALVWVRLCLTLREWARRGKKK